MPSPNIRRIHVFDVVALRRDFLDQVPSIVAQAVHESRERLPTHPHFATGSVAHYYAHRDLALGAPSSSLDVPEGPRLYAEAHLSKQCRGAFVIAGSESAFPVFLASGARKSDDEFNVYRKGPMTLTEAGGQPALFEVDFDFDPSISGESSHGHAFFLVVNRFQLRAGIESIEVHLVWGYLKDRYTIHAIRQKRLGDADLPPIPTALKSPDFPPIFSADPMLEIVEDDHGS